MNFGENKWLLTPQLFSAQIGIDCHCKRETINDNNWFESNMCFFKVILTKTTTDSSK